MATWQDHDGGVDWQLDLDRELLLPNRIVGGRVSLTAQRPIDARGLSITLRAEEHWRHRQTSSDGRGHTSTRVVTSRADVIQVPVEISTALHLAAGERFDRPFELPVPPLGPASLEAEDAGVDWTIEAKLDIPGGLDSSITRPVAVAQPLALLRAGVVRLGEFALYDSAQVADGAVRGSITLAPAPLVCGAPFSGRVRLTATSPLRLQDIRAELRVHVEATVSGGESQDVIAWAGEIAPAMELADARDFDLAGILPAMLLPTVELPHGRTDATFRIILAQAWAADPNLVRDVAVATTTEL